MNWPEVITARAMLLVAPLEPQELAFLAAVDCAARYDLCIAWAARHFQDLGAERGVEAQLQAAFGQANLIIIIARTALALLEQRLLADPPDPVTGAKAALEACGEEFCRLVRESVRERRLASSSGITTEQFANQLWGWRSI